jgi:elongation factor Ts
MAAITASLVKQLRDATNVSMMECKRALEESGGDIAGATKLLREKGIAVAAKKASRATNQGLIASASAEGGKVMSLIEVNCETDFVARNPGFQAFVSSLAQRACLSDDPLSEQVKAEVTAKIAEIGENIVIRRNVRFALKNTGRLASYIHLGGKVGVLVELNCTKPETVAAEGFATVLKDLTLHVAAASPKYLTSKDVPADVIASEREIFAKQVQNKPANVVEKIVDGKIKKFFTEVCLLDQEFVKEAKQSIAALLAATGKALNDTLSVRAFARYQLGE